MCVCAPNLPASSQLANALVIGDSNGDVHVVQPSSTLIHPRAKETSLVSHVRSAAVGHAAHACLL